jgi:hypothetical protein
VFRLKLRRPCGKLSALVAFCYLCLSLLLPGQHTDHLAFPARAAAFRQERVSRTGRHASSAAKTALHSQDRCLACDWQAAQVSAALPAFTLVLTPPQPMRAITLFPRYLPLPAFPASSRAPPHHA